MEPIEADESGSSDWTDADDNGSNDGAAVPGSNDGEDVPGSNDGEDVPDISTWSIIASDIKLRGKIFLNILSSLDVEQLNTVVASGWDVNECLPEERQILEGNGWVEPMNVIGVEWLWHTALNRSIKCTWKEGVAVLLAAGADVNLHDVKESPDSECKDTPLMTAVRYGWKEGIEMLVEAGADVNLPSYEGIERIRYDNTPLMIAIQSTLHRPRKNVHDMVYYLLEHGADPHLTSPGNNNSAILVAIRGMDLPMVRLLMEKYKVDVNVARTDKESRFVLLGSTPLLAALEHVRTPQRGCHYDRQHLPHDDDLDDDENDTDTDSDDYEKQLDESVVHNRSVAVKLVRDLVEYGANVNLNRKGDPPPLHHCVSSYDFFPEILDFLYEEGCDMEQRVNGSTALHYSLDNIMRHSHPNNMRWLLRHGADTNVLKNGQSLIEVALSQFGFCSAELLVRAGATVSKESHDIIEARLFELETPRAVYRRSSAAERATKRSWEELEPPDTETRADDSTQSIPEHSHVGGKRSRLSADLLETNDVSLKIYPVEEPRRGPKGLDSVRGLHNFLSQPRNLMWSSRKCLRENLVSLLPTFVKTLPLAGELKRYILCYEL